MRLVPGTSLLPTLAALTLSVAVEPRALAQAELPQVIPELPLDTDVNEVDDIPEMEEPAAGKNGPQSSRKLEAEFLKYSVEEMRSRFNHGVSLGLGATMPWQSYTLEADDQIRPDLALGFYCGGGGFKLTGDSIDGRAYDLTSTTHGFGVVARYWIPQLDRLSVEASLGYLWWSGTISPHGSDTAITDPEQRLGSSYQASGLTGGLALSIQWLWESGFYLQWMPVGFESAVLVQQDQSLDSDAVKSAVRGDLQRARIYGVIDLKFGYLF